MTGVLGMTARRSCGGTFIWARGAACQSLVVPDQSLRVVYPCVELPHPAGRLAGPQRQPFSEIWAAAPILCRLRERHTFSNLLDCRACPSPLLRGPLRRASLEGARRPVRGTLPGLPAGAGAFCTAATRGNRSCDAISDPSAPWRGTGWLTPCRMAECRPLSGRIALCLSRVCLEPVAQVAGQCES